MDPSIQSKLIECLDALQQGQTVAQVLARYPQEREQLRPLLETAAKLQEFNLQPSLAAQTRSREAFLAEAEALSDKSRARSSSPVWLRRLLVPVAALVMLFVLGAGLITVSAAAVPGDPLYGAKRLAESLQLVLAADAAPRAELLEQFRQERIAEIRQLMAKGRDAEVEFEGMIQSIQDDTWRIAGLNTQVNDATEISGAAQVGGTAVVAASVRGGDLIARSISIIAAPSPVPQPTPTDTVTPTPTAEPSSTPTAEPVDNAEPRPPATTVTDPQPTDTPTPTATKMPEPTATATPAVVQPVEPPPPTDDNSNDGSGVDNSNDNSHDGEENQNDASDDHGENDNEASDSNHNDNSDGGEEENSNDNSNDNSGHGGDDHSEDNSNNENAEDNKSG